MTITRATLTAKEKDALPTSAFAYTDAEGNNHLPIHDQAHVQAALGRFGQTEFDSDSEKPAAAKKIVKAAKGFGMTIGPSSDVGKAAGLKPAADSNSARADNPMKTCPTCKGAKKIMEGNRKCPTCHATGVVPDTSSNSVDQAEWHERVQQGLLEGASHAWEERQDMTFDDVRRAVQSALCDALGAALDDNDYLYVQDLTADWAVYSCNYDGQLYQVDYSCSDDGACTVDVTGQKEVARVTTYAPVPGTSQQGQQTLVEQQILPSLKPLSAVNSNSADLPATGRSEQMCCDGRTAADHREHSADGLCCTDGTDEPELNSAPHTHEHREKVPVKIKRAAWAYNGGEWSWPYKAQLEVRSKEPAKGETELTANFTGYASTTGGEGYHVSDWLGTYVERMAPGCFVKTLRDATAIPLLFNHAGLPLASYDGGATGTSQLAEDATGLRNDALLDLRSSLSNDVAISVSRGDLTKMSFSFAAIKQAWSADYEERDVTDARLYDTSIVTFPANPATSAAMRSAMQESLGREGMGIFSRLATNKFVRGERDDGFRSEGDLLIFEMASRALRVADEAAVKMFGQYGRARTFIVGDVLEQSRVGAAISAANVALLKQALSALHDADTALSGVDKALDEGQQAISSLLQVANPDDDDPDEKPAAANTSGVDGDQGGGNGSGPGGNPITPSDGAGSREAERELEERKARGKKFGALVLS